jgi:hypothetical protein
MNERIQELKDKIWAEEYWTKPNTDKLLPAQLNRFAELIVRECAEQSMSIGRYNTPSGITPDLAIAIAVGLKKHFGVEE